MNPTTMSDSQLDASFANSWDNKDFTSANVYQSEITTRLTSVSSFVSGLFGGGSFPLYEARTGFSQSGAAQGSTGQAVVALPSNVVSTVATTVNDMASGVGTVANSLISPLAGTLSPFLLLGGAVVIFLILKESK